MVKLELSRKIPFLHILREFKSIIAESGRLVWGSQPTFQPKNIDTYYGYFENNGTIQRSIIDLTEQALGQGFFTTIDEDEKAKELCDELCQKQNFDEFLPNIGKNMLIAGFLPVETKMNKLPSKCALKIVHPRSVDKVVLDEKTAKLDHIIQKSKAKKGITLSEAELAWFTYNKVGNDPRGTSLVKGIVDILGYQENAIKNMDRILARYASPLGIWKSKRDISPIRKIVQSVEAGEDLFFGNLTDEELKDLVQYIEIDPRARFWEFYDYLDRKVYESLGAPSLGYWRNATQASAEVLDDIVQRNIHALQRNIKRVVEAKWFGPLCELNKCKEVPRLEWGMEKTGVEDLNISEFITKGLEIGYITLPQFVKLLQQMGLRIEQEKEEEGEVSGASQPPEEGEVTEASLRESVITRTVLEDSDEITKTCPKNPTIGHQFVLGRLRQQDSVWVCKFCGAVRVVPIKEAL